MGRAGVAFMLTVAVPEVFKQSGVRVLPLEGFDPVEVAIMWQGEATPLIQLVLDESRRYARELFPDWVWEEE